MNPIGQHIQNAIAAGRVKNAAELAARIKVTEATVSRWKSGDRAPSAHEAMRLETALGIPEGMLMAEAEAQRAKDEATRAAWLRVARLCARSTKSSTTIALAMLAIVVLYLTGEAETLYGSIAWLGLVTNNTNYGAFVLGIIVTITLFWALEKSRGTTTRRPELRTP